MNNVFFQNSDVLVLSCVGIAAFAFVFSAFVFNKSAAVSVLGWRYAFETSVAVTIVSTALALVVIGLGYAVGQATGATAGYLLIATVFPPALNKIAMHVAG